MKTIEIERELLQIVFDVAINSVNFSASFLDDEEVLGLRAIAEILGVDPMEATPLDFKKRFSRPKGAQHEEVDDGAPSESSELGERKEAERADTSDLHNKGAPGSESELISVAAASKAGVRGDGLMALGRSERRPSLFRNRERGRRR